MKMSSKTEKIDDSVDNIIQEIKKLVVDDKRCVSYTHVSQRFRVHVENARQILRQFRDQYKESELNLAVNYFLCGNNNNDEDDDELKIERFLIVDESEVESTKSFFKNLVFEDIYSVALDSGDGNVANIELNFDEYECNATNPSELQQIQSLSYKRNDKIGFRNLTRRSTPAPVVPPVSELKDNETKIKSESNTKHKTQTNKSKASNRKNKNSVKSMFSKQVKSKPKQEVIDDEANDDDNDPFKSESEDDMKIDDKQENEDDNNSDDVVIEKEVKNSDESEEIVEEKRVSNKRSSNTRKTSEDEDSEEEIVKTKKKSKAKRYKRIRIISDSESDQEDDDEEEKVDAKDPSFNNFKNVKKDECKPLVKREEVKETYVDDDGYVVTQTVKKDVVIEKNGQKEEPIVVNNKNKKDINESLQKDEPNIADNKSKKNIDENKNKSNERSKEKETTKSSNKRGKIDSSLKSSKSLNEVQSKKQTSITSFFKPKQINA